MLEKIADKTDQVRIIAGTEVDNFVMNEPAVKDCDFKKRSSLFQEYGPVLWASDGYTRSGWRTSSQSSPLPRPRRTSCAWTSTPNTSGAPPL
eukprot:5823667-Heterocapsa_arctica.AAC.1